MSSMQRSIFVVVGLFLVAVVAAVIPLSHRGVVDVAAKRATNGPRSRPLPGSKPFGVLGNWRLVFDDEFNGTSLGSDWIVGLRGNGGELETPTNPQDLAAYSSTQVKVGGGVLTLTAARSAGVVVNGNRYSYVSGAISTTDKRTFTYGYFEARLYFPGGTGLIYNWPAFWLDGRDWPTDGELDVVEGLDGLAAYHFHSDAGGPGAHVTGNFTGWHTYGADWEPGSVTFYYDGREVGRITDGVTSQPMALLIDYAVSPPDLFGGAVVAPASMEVDYVRVWQH
jgi:beta-glucanase (GH16 family)